MKLDRVVSVSVALSLLWACAAAPAWGDRDRRNRDRRGDSRPEQRHDFDRMRMDRRDTPRGYIFDNRYRHDRYYPPRGHAIPTLPRDHRIVHYRGVPYYFHGGVWYRRSGTRFVVIAPPLGLVVPFLPLFYTTIWVAGIPYYYADNVYYVWSPEQNGYVVTEAPPEQEVREQPAAPEQLFIYPKKGQSEQQQATDRYECHRWGVGQSGFDPTQPGGNVPEAQRAAKRADYQRAMKACLEARGYSVQ
jgi:hypothetical protein